MNRADYREKKKAQIVLLFPTAVVNSSELQHPYMHKHSHKYTH